MKTWYAILLAVWLLTGIKLFAQEQLRVCETVVNSHVLTLQKPVLSSSIRVFTSNHKEVTFTYDTLSNSIVLDSLIRDTVFVCYRIFPSYLTKEYQLRKAGSRSLRMYSQHQVDYSASPNSSPNYSREELFESSGIQKNGTLSRGISVGNTQSVFVNSTLNLQLEGQLTPDVTLKAVISDRNIPIQPDGTTQQIQNFDRVYMQFEGFRSRLMAGDLVLKNRSGHYLKYQRNVQGGQFETTWDSTQRAYTSIGAALSKGKFASTQLTPLEGVSGPYRLVGPSGERFILVLANSEKVFLDGKLLTRGWDYDYVIDYNLAQITFTNKILITRFSRLRVDFEYADRNYSRATSLVTHEHNFNKGSMLIQYYNEKDNPNQPINTQLDNADKQSLSLAGDDPKLAFLPGFDQVSFDPNKILYQVDTILISGVPKAVFTFSTNPDSARYQVVFTEVLPSSGDYVRDKVVAQGTIYKYVGAGLGNYVSEQVIPLPKQKRMLSISGTLKTSKYSNVLAEFATSEQDENLYSNLDDSNNKGIAALVGYQVNAKPIKNTPYKWNASTTLEWNDQTFRPIDRFRPIEFDRDWSADVNTYATNMLYTFKSSAIKDKLNKIEYSGALRDKVKEVYGTQHSITLMQQKNKVRFTSSYFIMNNSLATFRSDWDRALGKISYDVWKVRPGIQYSYDHNTIKKSDGAVLKTAMYFDEWKGFVSTKDSSRFFLEGSYSYREDKDTLQSRVAPFSYSKTKQKKFTAPRSKNHSIKNFNTYRQLNYARFTSKNEETFMSRIDWTAFFLRRTISSDFSIATGAGRELKREFIFVEVPVGQGGFVFKDQNNNSVKELDEFLPDNLIGNYVKTFVATDQYIRAYNLFTNYRLNIKSPDSWQTEKGMKKILSRFSNTSTWVSDRKVTSESWNDRVNPFLNRISDNSLLSFKESIRSTFFFNRANPKGGGDFTYSSNLTKQLLTSGFDSTASVDYLCNTRINASDLISIRTQLLQRDQSSSSDFLINRNYRVRTYKIQPEIAIQPTVHTRYTLITGISQKTYINIVSRLQMKEIGGEVLLNKAIKRALSAQVKMVEIAHGLADEVVQSPVGYLMLEGLSKGINWTWQIKWQQKLSNGLQIQMSYDGRKPNQLPPVHIGRVQVSALF